MVILGGGVIGCEFASVWKSFGAEVTIVEALPHLVPLEDEATSKLLERAFRKRGIGFELGARFAGVEKTETGVRVSLENGKTIEADLLLVAVGRGPVSQDLGYEQVGVEMERGFVKVDEPVPDQRADDLRGRRPHPDPAARARRLRRGHPGRRAARRARARRRSTTTASRASPTPSPRSPRSASPRPGAKEQVRRRTRRDLTYDLAGNGKSQILKTAGFVKLVRQKDGPVVGVHMVGSRVGELVAEAQLIYNWEAFPDEVAQLIHAHPTQTEAIGEAHLALAGKPLHAHG